MVIRKEETDRAEEVRVKLVEKRTDRGTKKIGARDREPGVFKEPLQPP